MSRCAHCGFEFPQEAMNCPACGRPLHAPPSRPRLIPPPPVPQSGRSFPPPIPRPQPMTPGKPGSKTPWGVFVAVGCAGFIAFGGLIAAILIPNFLDALQKAKTKRTLADLRSLGSALDIYAEENYGYPAAASMADVAAALEPTYLTTVPRADGWEREFRYQCWGSSGAGACDAYRLVSAGSDGVFELDDPRGYQENETDPRDYGRDIVYGDGFFIQFPGGLRRATPPPPPPDPR